MMGPETKSEPVVAELDMIATDGQDLSSKPRVLHSSAKTNARIVKDHIRCTSDDENDKQVASTRPRRSGKPLLGSFEENALNFRLDPVRTVEGYVAEIRASNQSKQTRPLKSNVHVNFYSAGTGCYPYVGQVQISRRGYRIPRSGTLQVTLFNPHGTLVKLFLLRYDLCDMPSNAQTFLRQTTYFQASSNHHLSSSNPSSTENNRILENQDETSRRTYLGSITTTSRRRIRYMMQLNIVSSKTGRIYLNKDLRMFVSKKVHLETASQFTHKTYELRSLEEMPRNPTYFSR